jgi:hypothetical protein
LGPSSRRPWRREAADGRLLQLGARGARLGEAGGEHHDRAHAALAALLDDARNVLGGCRDHCQVDRLGQVEHRSEGRDALHQVGVVVDRVDRAAEPVVQQVAEHLGTQSASALARPDHRDRGRCQHRPHRGRLGGTFAAVHRGERCAGGIDVEGDLHHALVETGRHLVARRLEHAEHPAVVGQRRRAEPAQAVLQARSDQVLEQQAR